MARWEISEADKWIEQTLANDSTIKTRMHETTRARVFGYRLPKKPKFFYIYFYCIPGPDTPGQGTSRIQSNPDYDIEVRTLGAPTDDSEAVVDRIDELIGKAVRAVTPSGEWMISARRIKPISMVEQGESAEVFYTRRGGTYQLRIVPA